MIHQLKLTLFIELRKERELGIGGAAFDQAAARVVTDTTNHRGANAGRANHRVGVLPKGRQQLFEAVKGAPGKHQRLLRIADRDAGIEPERVNNHDLTVVILAVRR